jgi:hypothetical protein
MRCALPVKGICNSIPIPACTSSGKTLSEFDKQHWISTQSNAERHQQPDDADFFAKKSDPLGRIRGDFQIRFTNQTTLHFNRLVTDRHCTLSVVLTGEAEVEGCIQAFRLAWLKDDVHPGQEAFDRCRTQC